ncbi:SMC family ATPase [Candidatus Bathyarchaeota archaeon]|jgi:DNA repair protein SbcC/Rad50|nr:SMC family ATPase [Candidatus Bathyarchaeota archaeon]
MFKLASLKASGFKRLDLMDKMSFPDGRMLVHGINESGKSTIMEAIHYALYGFALRPNKRAGKEDLIAYGKPSAIIELEFSIDDAEYQIRREIKRKGANVHLLNKREDKDSLSRITTGATAVNKHILEILHGIDSDALLNSCLVEQKELGKLEASNKQDRIKAMSSLLNMESFVDARDNLRKDRSELEKTHSENLRKLQRAARAAEDYEEAEKRKTRSEERLGEIAEEKKTVGNVLGKLEKELSVILEMKQIQTVIDRSDNRLEGRLAEEKLIEENLERVIEAEKNIDDLEAQLPDAEKRLKEATEKLSKLDELQRLDGKINELETRRQLVKVRHGETVKNHEEAEDAEQHLIQTEMKVKEYELARTAEEVLNKVHAIILEHIEVQREVRQIEAEINQIQDRLGQQMDSESRIRELEGQERVIEGTLKMTQNMKTASSVLLALGIVGLILYGFNQFFPIIGIILLISGGYLFSRSKTDPVEDERQEIRTKREAVLGDIARIKEYRESLQTLEKRQIKPREILSSLDIQIDEELRELPRKPREYRQIIKLAEPSTIDAARSAVQEDLQNLARIQAEGESFRQRAAGLKEYTRLLKENRKELEAIQKSLDETHGEISQKEKESGISATDEEELRNERRSADIKLTQLNATIKQTRDGMTRKPQIEKNLQAARTEIARLLGLIKENTEKLEEVTGELGLNPEDERETRRRRDNYLRRSSSLRTEEMANRHIRDEATSVIGKTAALNKEYPQLKEQAENDEFKVEAMKRAIVLLDTTRDGIMGGVKQNVEKNMMQFLPTLTDNRYNRAQIVETDYRINVYDREAKKWRGKGVFSGATQDQFSLALRLAFAISTIPQSRGARPGFIFLDEPLSGFDTQRRDGFMRLLREELSQYFDQIIVVSHIEELKEEFPYHVNLDEGRIVKVQR